MGEDLVYPYRYDWKPVPAGIYTLTARAVRDDGFASTAGVDVEIATNTGIKEEGSAAGFTHRIYPNPFSDRTEIAFLFPANTEEKNARFSIYNVTGRLVRTFSLDGSRSTQTTITWDGKDNTGGDLSSGLYFGILKAGSRKISKSFILIR